MKSAVESSIQDLRQCFPALKNKSYLNFGAQGCMSASTIDAIMDAYRFVQEEGPLSNKMFHWIVQQGLETKELLSREFGGNPNSYALTQNATEGCNIVLWGFDWQEGESILLSDSEHNGVIMAVKQLCRRRKLKLEICRFSKCSNDDEILAELYSAISKSKTRFLLYSHVLWNTGKVLPAQKINEICRQHKITTLVDGAQSAGVLPLDIAGSGSDFYACTGHKWLGGPEGVGFLYAAPQSISLVEPTFAGWRGAVFGSKGEPVGFQDSAARFEVATAAFPLLSGFREALRFQSSFASQKERYELIKENTEYLRSMLSAIKGLELLDKNGGSSLVSFTLSKQDHTEIVKKLDQSRIILRTIPDPSCIRASVHFFSRIDLDVFCSKLSKLLD